MIIDTYPNCVGCDDVVWYNVVIYETQCTDCIRYLHWISKRRQDMSWKKGYNPLVCINYDCKTTRHRRPWKWSRPQQPLWN